MKYEVSWSLQVRSDPEDQIDNENNSGAYECGVTPKNQYDGFEKDVTTMLVMVKMTLKVIWMTDIVMLVRRVRVARWS